jgi:hypothetical protein
MRRVWAGRRLVDSCPDAMLAAAAGLYDPAWLVHLKISRRRTKCIGGFNPGPQPRGTPIVAWCGISWDSNVMEKRREMVYELSLR